MKTKHFMAAAAVVLGATLASAAQADGLNYTFAQAGYAHVSPDSTTGLDSGNGYELSGSYALPQNFFVLGSYSHTNLDAKFFPGVSQTNNDYSVGAGYHYALNQSWDLVGSLAYGSIHTSIDGPFPLGNPSSTDTGYDLEAGVRGLLTDKLEFDAAVDHASPGSSANSVTVGLVYSFTRQFALGAAYSQTTVTGVTNNAYELFARVYF